jgi:hypothetical protein
VTPARIEQSPAALPYPEHQSGLVTSFSAVYHGRLVRRSLEFGTEYSLRTGAVVYLGDMPNDIKNELYNDD